MKKTQKIFNLLNKALIKKRTFVFLFFLAAVSSFLEVLPTELLGRISSMLPSIPRDGISQLFSWCLIFFVVVVTSSIVRNFFCYATSKCANTIIKNVRSLAFAKLLSIDYTKLPQADSGYCINMVNSNTSRLETVFSVALFTLISDLFDLLWISYFIYRIDYKLLLMMLLFIVPLYMLGIKSSKMQKKYALNRIDIESKIISSISAAFKNLPIIRVFHGQNRESDQFNKLATEYKDESNKADATLSAFYILEKTIRYISISSVLFVTASGIIQGKYELGALVTIVLYSQQFYSPITNIIRYLQMLQKGMASVEAIDSFLDTEDIAEHANIHFNRSEDFLTCTDVDVKVNDTVILPATNLVVSDKSLNLIYGDSGAGKSTLFKALLGLIPISHGNIAMSSDFKNAKIFSYASQNAEIFAGSILDNVLYPKTALNASEAELSAAKLLLTRLGFNNSSCNKDVGESGCNLSGGEKKRIAFARAILMPSKILLLDEITSNLDIENERIMTKLITSESKKRCVILITHKEFSDNSDVVIHNIGR